MWGGLSMLTNSDCTIYHRIRSAGSSEFQWEKQYVKECWWFVDAKSNVTTEGLKSADVLKLRIPDLSVKVEKDDILVKGNCTLEIQTVKDFAGIKCFKATTVNYNRFGDSPHIKVVGA